MRKFLLASAAIGALSLGAAITAAQASPLLGGKLTAQESSSAVEKIWWKRVCDRDGDRCRRVWIRRDRDDDRRPQLRLRLRDRDRDDRR